MNGKPNGIVAQEQPPDEDNDDDEWKVIWNYYLIFKNIIYLLGIEILKIKQLNLPSIHKGQYIKLSIIPHQNTKGNKT